MTTIHFLADWALRSSILIATGALLLLAFRVRDVSVRLAVWTAMLCGSVFIPVMMVTLPRVPVRVMQTAAPAPAATAGKFVDTPTSQMEQHAVPASTRLVDWTRAAIALYALIAGALLLRIVIGLVMSLRLLRSSRAAGMTGVRESDHVVSPVTLGIVKPAIVLPSDWSQWDERKLDAVLAHERSHIGRYDPLVQLASAIHRALLWHSPLSWLLHSRIVRLAECASDDAAVAVSSDRTTYAEILLDFMRRGAPVRGTGWSGVPMARYGRADQRIQRILDGAVLSRGVTRWTVAAILVLGSPLAYVVAMANPEVSTPVRQPMTAVAPVAVPAAPARVIPETRVVAQVAPSAAPKKPDRAPGQAQAFIPALGNVTAVTVTARPRTDGQLMSVSFKEGEMVQVGQVLASIDPSSLRELQAAEQQRDLDARELSGNVNVATKQRVAADAAQITYLKELTQIKAPITGLAGFRLAEPGQIVRAADERGIVVITQIQPIAVIIMIPQDWLPQVRARLKAGESPMVEAWNRDNTAKIATGVLTAVDNQIDMQTGTVKLKAMFDNKDGALFPNQFVNVRLY